MKNKKSKSKKDEERRSCVDVIRDQKSQKSTREEEKYDFNKRHELFDMMPMHTK